MFRDDDDKDHRLSLRGPCRSRWPVLMVGRASFTGRRAGRAVPGCRRRAPCGRGR
jgi:hypothetical protein